MRVQVCSESNHRCCARWLGVRGTDGVGPPYPLMPFRAGSSVCLPAPTFLAWWLFPQTAKSRKEKLASCPHIVHSSKGWSQLLWALGPQNTELRSGESFSTQLVADSSHPSQRCRVTVVPHSGCSPESPRSATPRPHREGPPLRYRPRWSPDIPVLETDLGF